MHLDELIGSNVAIELGCRFNVVDCGSRHGPQWHRVFVLHKGVTLGRLSFRDYKLFSVKCYKRSYHDVVDETDYIFYRLNYWLATGIIISRAEFDGLVILAEEKRVADLEEKKAWRQRNPPGLKPDGTPKRRRKLTGRNVRHILADMVREYAL